jgi:hypothetical protein
MTNSRPAMLVHITGQRDRGADAMVPHMVEPTFAPPEPAQPPVKKLRWGRLFIYIGVLVVIFCGGGAVLVGPSLFDVNDAQAAASRYLTAAQNGDFNSQYAQLCKQVRQKITPATFERQPRLNSYEITAASARIGFGHASKATVVARLHLTGGVTIAQGFNLIREDGEWRVCE